MRISIINIGDELLIGQVVNTNASWIGEQLNKNNIIVDEVAVISDAEEGIVSSIDRLLKKSDGIIVTGGLGPTNDDITKKVLLKIFGGEMRTHEPSLNNVVSYFEQRGIPMTPVQYLQAELPSSCEGLLNLMGTAPGMWFEKDGKIVVSLPGVPYEMRYLIQHEVIPRLRKVAGNQVVLHKTILTCGVGESMIAERIEDWENNLPNNFKLAYLPNSSMVRLRLSAYANDQVQTEAEMQKQLNLLLDIISDIVFGVDTESIEEVIASILKRSNSTVSVAESCSGGFLAHRLTAMAGASEYFKGSVVAYDNSIKHQLLGVDNNVIEAKGAVSEEVALAMALGAKNLLKTDYAVATTGIAGPTGGTDEKPVGTVWIAVATPEGVTAKRFGWRGDREQIIYRTSQQALFELFNEIKNK